MEQHLCDQLSFVFVEDADICQVRLSSFLPRSGQGWVSRMPSLWAVCTHDKWMDTCVQAPPPLPSQLQVLTGQPRIPDSAQEQSGHLCKSGEGRGQIPSARGTAPWGLDKGSWRSVVLPPHPEESSQKPSPLIGCPWSHPHQL